MVLDSVLQQVPSPDLAVHVVWTPVLPTDSYEEARRAHILLPDPRARFYWDADQDLGLVYGRTVDLPRGRDLAWDIYFVFGPDAVWEETVPVPDAWSHQLGQDARHLGDGTDLRNAIQKHLPEPEPRSEARPAGEEATVTLQVGGMQKSRGGAT